MRRVCCLVFTPQAPLIPIRTAVLMPAYSAKRAVEKATQKYLELSSRAKMNSVALQHGFVPKGVDVSAFLNHAFPLEQVQTCFTCRKELPFEPPAFIAGEA
jgi:hypothetical protein